MNTKISQNSILSRFIMVSGVKIYDPRDNTWKVSDNPALIMADLAYRGYLKTSWRLDKVHDNPFWAKIGILADSCDSDLKI
uniref:Putative structural protein n=1 Tax=viral metagenome TaxID=1070528 RepID=A0A6M3LI81_9ZZZZ